MPTADTGTVTMQIDGHIGTITVDNQSKKNADTPTMLDRLAELLTEYDDNDGLRVATLFQSFVERRAATFSGY